MELFRNLVMRAGRFLDACAWRLGCFLPDRRLQHLGRGLSGHGDTQGGGSSPPPAEVTPKSSPLPKIPAPAGSHLAHQITSNPGLWLGFAHHLLIWGVAALPCRIFTPPTPVSGGRRPDTAGPPPGAPCPGAAEERRCPLAARPRPQLAPAWPLHCILIIFLLFLSHGPAKPPGELLSVRAGGCRRWLRAVGAGGAQSPLMQDPLPQTPRPGLSEDPTKISPLLTPNGMLLCSLTQQVTDHGCSWVQERSHRNPGAKHQSIKGARKSLGYGSGIPLTGI